MERKACFNSVPTNLCYILAAACLCAAFYLSLCVVPIGRAQAEATLAVKTPQTPLVAVALGDYLGEGGEDMAPVARRHYEAVTAALKQVRIPFIATSDSAIEQHGVPDVEVLILPYNRAISPAELEQVEAFMKSGGRIIACYVAPRSLLPALGCRTIAPRKASEIIGDTDLMYLRQDSGPGMPEQIRQPVTWLMTCEPDSGEVIGWWDGRQGEKVPAVIEGPAGTFIACGLTSAHLPDAAQLLRALVGRWAPDIWEQSIPTSPAHLGPYGPYLTLAQLAEDVQKKSADGQDVVTALSDIAEAFSLLDTAAGLKSQGRFEESLAAARRADSLASDALWKSFAPVDGEMRGVWMHNYAKPSWEVAAKKLADANFNAVFPYICSAGCAFYDSDVLPHDKSVAEEGDFLQKASEACRRYDLPLHPRVLNLATLWATAETKKALANAGRLVVTNTGSTGTWLCPSHPANRRLQVDVVREIVTGYDVTGVQFDYLRYPWKNVCFCDRCRAEFEQIIGRRVQKWPESAYSGDLRDEYLDFRRHQINTLVAELYQTVKDIDPQLEVSAAVFINWESHRDTFGQDWKTWVDNGWVDFVCPMDYTDDLETLRGYVRRQNVWVDNQVPMFTGIGVNTDKCRNNAPYEVLRQIEVAREEGADGWVIFNYCPLFEEKILPRMSPGLTRKPTRYRPAAGE